MQSGHRASPSRGWLKNRSAPTSTFAQIRVVSWLLCRSNCQISDKVVLDGLISKGKAPAKVILKARILLKADKQMAARAGWMRRSSWRSTRT